MDLEEDEMELLKRDMVEHLSLTREAHIKSQQLGEPELTREQKRTIVKDILEKDPADFLARFRTHLLPHHSKYFRQLAPRHYTIDFYLKEMENRSSQTRTRVKNRRLEALKRLVTEGEYFSEAEMKKRNPLLYEELIGRYLSQEEKNDRLGFDYSNATLSQVLLEKYDRDRTQKLLEEQMDEYDAAVEEEEEDDEDEEGEHYTQQLWGTSFSSEPKQLKKENTSEIEKQMLCEEFRSHMFSSFLHGKDDFDYSTVDANPDYDDMDELDRDYQERYFDSESPTPMEGGENHNEEQEQEEVPNPDLSDPLDAYMSKINPP